MTTTEGIGGTEAPGAPGAGPAPPGGGVAPRGGARRRRRRRLRRTVVVVAAALVLVVLGVVAWYEVEANPLGGSGPRVVVEVRDGEGMGTLASTLAGRRVISSALAFRLSLLVHGSPELQPGGYLFHTNQSFGTVRGILDRGPDVSVVDVMPGNTLREIAQQLSSLPGDLAHGFLAMAQSGAAPSPYATGTSGNLEGLLGTGDYQILPGETAHQLLTQMVARFDHEAAQAGLTPAAASAVGLTPYQVVTVASIAEKEGYYERYFGPVARVIYNRLAGGMHLDMTSTVLYALGQDGGAVTPADQSYASPYNTYLNPGLPPTPICFPSEKALAAAVAPPPGGWLYFTVVSKAGTTLFADTYTQQLANEQLAKSRGLG